MAGRSFLEFAFHLVQRLSKLVLFQILLVDEACLSIVSLVDHWQKHRTVFVGNFSIVLTLFGVLIALSFALRLVNRKHGLLSYCSCNSPKTNRILFNCALRVS